MPTACRRFQRNDACQSSFDRHSRSEYRRPWRAGGLIYISGQTANDEHGQLIGQNDFDAQAKQVFHNLERVLKAGGSSLGSVIKVNIYLTDMGNFPEIVELRKQYFSKPYPADTIAEVNALASPGMMIEIEAMALAHGKKVDIEQDWQVNLC